MDNHIQSSESKTKNITLKGAFAWIVGVILILAGISELFSKPFAGIILLIASGITIPPFYEFIKHKLHISLSTGVRVVVIIVLMAISGSLMGDISKPKQVAVQSESQPEQKTEVVEQRPEVIRVSAIQLYDAYQANEVSADTQYKGKLVRVSGTVDSIAKDLIDTPYVTLKASASSFFGIQCMFSRADESVLAKIQKGQSIILQGEVSGKMGNVIIRNCEIN